MDFSAKIKQIRRSTGCNQTEFGKIVGLSQQAVSDLEKGRKKPSKTLVALLKYRYSDIFFDENKDQVFIKGYEIFSEKKISDRLVLNNKPPYTVIINHFRQKNLAWDINYKLLCLESFNPEELKDIEDFINYRISKYDRRSGEDRRKEDTPELTPEDDRRSGIERRVANLKS